MKERFLGEVLKVKRQPNAEPICSPQIDFFSFSISRWQERERYARIYNDIKHI